MHLPTPYRPETAVVAQRLGTLAQALDWAAAANTASPWVQAVRSKPPPFWALESLLKEYPIASDQGLALMRLAEALLRVPDAATAIALTADQLGRADFDATSDSALGRLSGAAIVLGKHFLPQVNNASSASGAGSAGSADLGTGSEGASAQAPGLLATLGARTVVAAALRAVQLLGHQFVLGQTIADALQTAASAKRKTPAQRYSFDMLGEGARTDADAQRYLASYRNAIESIAACADTAGACALNDGISIKLSALHPRYEEAQRGRVLRELVPRVWGLCEQAARANIPLTIDAEEADRLELSLDVLEALAVQVAAQHPQWQGLGLALQAYQTRALELVEHTIALARKHRIRLMCRLVKGAYWDFEIKRAQEMGLPHYPVFTHKHHTDISYLACARALLAAPDAIYPQFATHNAGTIAAILQMALQPVHQDTSPRSVGGNGFSSVSPGLRPPPFTYAEPIATHTPFGNAPAGARFELQRLHGMGEGVYREVLKNPQLAVRVYAPVGAHKDLLAYLVRRLLENGANASFVHQLANESVGMDALLASPLHLATMSALPLPPDLFGTGAGHRKNSLGLDLGVESIRAPLLSAYQTGVIPQVEEFDASQALTSLETSKSSYQKWSGTAVAARADVLRQAADALQSQLPHFCALLVKEAFKTWPDAVAEVREAVDFLRHYADEAERVMAPISLPGITGETNVLRLVPRGPWVCISPWNFPLAIFVGQVAAALATGNTVLAKPAEQTPGVAQAMLQLLHAAGVPTGALQLLHGPGETVGAALVAAPGVAGVVFTGSTAVAKSIQRALAAKDGPIVPLIAETGGINAMLVDSTALPEQVVDTVLQSAFRSAGQRCSALRLLCLHESIADAVIHMLQGAAQELVVGDPADLSTDVGPVIDGAAFEEVHKQLKRLFLESKTLVAPVSIAQAAIVSGVNDVSLNGDAPVVPHLIAPHAFEVNAVADVRQEIFGPVLHIVRWTGDPARVIAEINALGYGLTLGLHTRIDSRAQALAQAAHAGNVYINRNQIGAVVGSQPFGGMGLSGTGPKAGGPHYLARFCAEQTVTVNTTAAGGNAALLAGSFGCAT